MPESTSYTRSNPQVLQNVALPFYPRGTGIATLKKGQKTLSEATIIPFVEVMWGLEGIGEVVLYEQKFQIRENDVFFYLPGERHSRYALSGTWKWRWLCFDGLFAQAFMLSYQYPRFQHALQPYPADRFAELERNISEDDPFCVRKSAALIMELLAFVSGTNGAMGSGKIAKQALEIISAHLYDPYFDVGTLSESLHVSKNHLINLFREYTGKTPGRYILNNRLEQAMSLLRGTDAPVREVALRCGFAEPRTFTRFIKRALGVSPLEVRKKKDRIEGSSDPEIFK